MLTVMTVRCNQCGHENHPEYRFCGMCGAPMPVATAAREPERPRPSPPVGGPSFLGLGDDRSTDLDYLLDDEPPRGHGRLYLALLLLVVSAGLLAWHWQRDGYPWAGLALGPGASKTSTGSPPQAAPLATTPSTTTPPTTSPVANPAPGEAAPSGSTVTGASTQSPSPAAASPVGSSPVVASAQGAAPPSPISVITPEASPQTTDNPDANGSAPQPSGAQTLGTSTSSPPAASPAAGGALTSIA